jgi:hypothetical protein
MESGGKLWGGRFGDRRIVDQVMERFNSSISYDKRLCYVDILVFIVFLKIVKLREFFKN